MQLLLVEDHARIARFVANGLHELVDVAGTGDDALCQVGRKDLHLARCGLLNLASQKQRRMMVSVDRGAH